MLPMKYDAIGCLLVFVFFTLILGAMQMCDTLESNNKEEELYKIALQEDTHEDYLNYLQKYPKGKYYDEIKLKDDTKCWEIVLSNPSLKLYQWYIFLHPNGLYQSQAKEESSRLKEREEESWANELEAWNQAIEGGNYEKYLSYYPNGKHAVEAEERIVEGEIKRIMSGQYSPLPDMESSSTSSSLNESTSLISISNNTSFNLTIYYSGIDSKRVKLSPHQSATITLRNGNYKIGASVDAPNVSKYAGSKYLSGDYNTSYYIETRRY